MTKLKRLFWYCSGSNIQLLEKCPTDASKYAGIGATIFFTGLFATLATGYAVYTFTDSYWSAVPVAILWGAMIFNLDRYIVSSMRKTGNKRHELIMATPRIVLAILISIVISRPLELKIFEKEIATELTTMNAELKDARIAQLKSNAAREIANYQNENSLLDSMVVLKEKTRDELREIARQEADGTGGTLRRNAGPIYKIKKEDADKADKELGDLRARNNQLVEANFSSIDSIRTNLSTQITRLDDLDYTGLAARLEALSRISSKSWAIWMANWFIVLLFIAIETAPVFVKLISEKGPYDFLLAQEEHSFETRWLDFVAKANKATRKKAERADNEEQEYVNEQLSTRLHG